MKYRHELKYMISSDKVQILDYRLKTILKPDSIAKKKMYNIRSIYFDSYDNKCFYDNEAGLDERFKIRIRIYDCKENDIKLEIKYKKNGLTKKEFCMINKELCEKLLNGQKIDYNICQNKVLRKIFLEQNMNTLVPKIMVEYDRAVYADENKSIRITFDTNIRASKYINRYLDKNTYSKPIMHQNMHILEVKYDSILPDYIMKELEIIKSMRTSFSKYYFSRVAFKEEIL